MCYNSRVLTTKRTNDILLLITGSMYSLWLTDSLSDSDSFYSEPYVVWHFLFSALRFPAVAVPVGSAVVQSGCPLPDLISSVSDLSFLPAVVRHRPVPSEPQHSYRKILLTVRSVSSALARIPVPHLPSVPGWQSWHWLSSPCFFLC